MELLQPSPAPRAAALSQIFPNSPSAIGIALRLLMLAIVLLSSQLRLGTTQAAQAKDSVEQTQNPAVRSLLAEAKILFEGEQYSQAVQKSLDATKLEPVNKAAWYSVVEMSTLVAPSDAQPEIAIDACNRLMELGDKPYFALGVAHYRLDHWSEAMDALIKSRLEMRTPGACQDQTLGDKVALLYMFLAESLVRSGADDVALEMIREQTSPDTQVELVQRTINSMIDVEAWESIVTAAEIALPLVSADSLVAKELLFQTAFAQAQSCQFAACEKSTQAAQAIPSNIESLNAQCNNLPILLAAKREQTAKSSAPYRWLSDTQLRDRILQTRSAEAVDETVLQSYFLENVRRVRDSGLAERAKNQAALVIANDALQELPASTVLATQKLELLFLLSEYEQIENLLATPRSPAFLHVSSAWPAIVQAKQLSENDDSEKQRSAVELARKAFADDPDNLFSRIALKEAFGAAGNIKELLPFAKEGMQENCWRATTTVADFYQFADNPVESFMLNSLARKMPTANKPMLAWNRAELLHTLGMDVTAMKLFSDAFDSGFAASGARETAISLCLEKRKYDDALRYCQQEIALVEKDSTQPKSGLDLLPTHLQLAECHLARGEILSAEGVLVKIDSVQGVNADQADSRAKLQRKIDAASRDKAALMTLSHGNAGLMTSQMSQATKAVIDLKLLQRQLDHINSQHPWLSRQTWAGHHVDEKWNGKRRSITIPMPTDDGAQYVTVAFNRSSNGDLLSIDVESEGSTISTANCISIDSSTVQPATDFFEKLAALDFPGARNAAANYGNDGDFIPLEQFVGMFQALSQVLQEIETIDFKEAMIAGLHDTDGEPESAVYLWASMKDGRQLPLQCRFDLTGAVPRFSSFNLGESVKADFCSIDQQNAERFVTAFSSGNPDRVAKLLPESKRRRIDELPLFALFQTEFLAAAGQTIGIKDNSFTANTKMNDGGSTTNARLVVEFENAELPLQLRHQFDELWFFDIKFDEGIAWQGSDRVKKLLAANAQRDLTNYISDTPAATRQMLLDYGGFSKLSPEILAKEKKEFAAWMGDLQELKVMSAEYHDSRWELFFRVIGTNGQGRAKIFYAIDGFDVELDSFAVKPESSFAPTSKTD